jgi:hypothetical protein
MVMLYYWIENGSRSSIDVTRTYIFRVGFTYIIMFLSYSVCGLYDCDIVCLVNDVCVQHYHRNMHILIFHEKVYIF